MPSFTIAKISLAYVHKQGLGNVAISVASDIALNRFFNSIKAKQFFAVIYGGLTYAMTRF